MASIARRPDGKWRARSVDPGRHAACGAFRPQDRRRTVAVGDGYPGQRRHLRPARCRCRHFARIRRAVATVHDHRPGTSALYERVLRLHVCPVLGHRALASVRHSDARAFVTGLSTSLAPNTARQVHAITRTIFRSTVHDRLIVATPFADIKLPAIRWTRASALTVEQVRELAERAIPLLRALIVTAAGTGLRSDQDLHFHHLRASVRLGTHRRR